MGVATAVIAGLGVANAVGGYNAAKSQARLVEQAGAIKAYNRADEIKTLAARQRVAYVSAGLELEGTPQVVMNDTYNKGIADVLSIKASAAQEAKNIRKTAIAQLLGSLAQVGVNAYSMNSSLNTETGTDLNPEQKEWYNQHSSGGIGRSSGFGIS